MSPVCGPVRLPTGRATGGFVYSIAKGARIMRRRVRAVVASMVVAAAVVLGAAPAAAVEPLPPPVEPFPVQPSQAVKVWHTQAGQMGDRAFELFRALANGVKPESLGGQGKPPASVPKPITAPKPLNGTLGALSMVTFGWAIAANGTIALQSVFSEQDFDTIYCSQPGWYQATTTFVSLGLGPGCTSAVPNPNLDAEVSWGALSGLGVTVNFVGTTEFGSDLWACFSIAGSRPPGYAYMSMSYDGFYRNIQFYAHAACDWGTTGHWGWYIGHQTMLPGGSLTLSWPNAPSVALVNESTAQVAVEMSQSSGNPVRTPRCRITWENGSVTTGVGSTYTELDGIPVSAAGLGCEEAFVSQPGRGPGLMPERIEVESEQEGGAITTIADDTVPDFTESERQALWTTSSGGLTLMKVVNGVELSCMTWEANCVGWWPDTADGTSPSTTTGTYRCLFAGRAIDLAECGPYRHTFDTQTGTPTVTDPFTGTQRPWGTSTPQSQQQGLNTTDPSRGPSPGDTCMSEWSGVANPIEWVLHPVKCALVWAFVPRASVVEAAQATMLGAWSDTMLGQLPGIVIAAFTPPAGFGGCEGPHVHFELPWVDVTVDWYPLNACDGMGAQAAMYSRVISSVVLVYFTVVGVVRRISAVVNAPGIGGGGA